MEEKQQYEDRVDWDKYFHNILEQFGDCRVLLDVKSSGTIRMVAIGGGATEMQMVMDPLDKQPDYLG